MVRKKSDQKSKKARAEKNSRAALKGPALHKKNNRLVQGHYIGQKWYPVPEDGRK